jgi:RecA-family ATPase
LNNSDSKTDLPIPTPPAQTTEVDDGKDENGYELTPEEKKVDEPKKEETKVEEKPIEKPATGYGENIPEPVEEVVPPVEKKPEEMTDEEKAVKEFSDVIKDLGEGYDKDKVKKFAVENKLTKTQLEAYVKMAKEEDKAIVEKAEKARISQRKSWNEELKNDPDFGGANFAKNVDRVEKVLENNMPSTKKFLTDKGIMLPPYLMRDLLGIAKALNPTVPLVVGDPVEPKEDEGDFLDNLYS